MSHKVTLIPGDGIGPEVSRAARRIIDAAGVAITWEEVPAREPAGPFAGEFRHDEVVESVRRNRAALKGPMATAIAEGRPSINVTLRQALNLYANLRPVRNLEGVKARFDGVNG